MAGSSVPPPARVVTQVVQANALRGDGGIESRLLGPALGRPKHNHQHEAARQPKHSPEHDQFAPQTLRSRAHQAFTAIRPGREVKMTMPPLRAALLIDLTSGSSIASSRPD